MSGLAGQSIGLDEQSPTPIGGPAAIDMESKGSMENFIGFGAGATSYDPAPVDFDAADDTVTSAADGTTRYAPEYTDNQLVWGSGTPADGILFDTARGDSFLDGFEFSPSNGVVVTADSVAFDSDVATSVSMGYKNAAGVVLEAFDSFELTFEMNIRAAWPTTDIHAWFTGFSGKNFAQDWFGIMTKSHPAAAGNAYAIRYMNNSASGAGVASSPVGAGIPATLVISLKQGVFSLIGTYNGIVVIDLTSDMTLGDPVDIYELPRQFSTIGMVFLQGHVTVTGVKIAVDFPNAKYALVGDSITQGRFADSYPDGYAMVLRQDNPDDILACGAPGARIADWNDNVLEAVFDMTPKYAIVFLGTNDLLFVSEDVAKADYDALTAKIESAGIKVIAIGIPPAGNYKNPLFNDLLEQTYPRYIDCYTPLLGTGLAMNPAYDSGDGIHPNSAGHALIASTIQAAITANGWN